jgi:hypothetical protein
MALVVCACSERMAGSVSETTTSAATASTTTSLASTTTTEPTAEDAGQVGLYRVDPRTLEPDQGRLRLPPAIGCRARCRQTESGWFSMCG